MKGPPSTQLYSPGKPSVDKGALTDTSRSNSAIPTPQTPMPSHEIDAVETSNGRQRATERARNHRHNLEAAGRPTDYDHDNIQERQHPKAAPLRSCLADNLGSPIRAYKASQQGTETCPPCNKDQSTANHIYWKCPAFGKARNSDTRLADPP